MNVSPATTTTYTLTATSGAGSVTAQATVTVIVPPTINSFLANPGTINLGQSCTLSWNITNATSASIDHGVGNVNPSSGSTSVSPSSTTTYALTAINAAGAVIAQTTVTVNGGLPPDPGTVAPPIDPTVATTIDTATSFLYTGSNLIQTGVLPGTIEPKRTAVFRGKVMTSDSQPLSAVTISILNHPEYGQTLSRTDGMFDMAVNGGGYLTVNYAKAGYLPAQRQVDVPWQDYQWLPDVILIPVDTQVTTVDLTKPDPFQVARGSVVTDSAGSRQATLLFPSGTTATLVMPDGTTQGISTLNIRATEYTVGPNGPKAMPAELPANSAYTYCVELSADEAILTGAQSVQFSQPIIFYLENYLYAAVGSNVPVGYYDRVKGVWVPSDSGRVIKIISITGGLAQIDTDGDGVADTGLGITDAERQYLATLYAAGQELWRVLISHFSPWDYNWAFGPPADATFPNQPPPKKKGVEDCEDEEEGASTIGCQNQTLGQDVDIVGTPFGLHYRSNRSPGYKPAYMLEIPLSGPTVPASLIRIELAINVAGMHLVHHVVGGQCPPPCLSSVIYLTQTGEWKCGPSYASPGGSMARSQEELPAGDPPIDLRNQSYIFTWDGKDAYGRTLQGVQPATIRIGYTYCGSYEKTDKFGYNGNGMITGSSTSEEVTLWQRYKTSIGPMDARPQGLGGWTLSPHHTYDPLGRVLYLGNGKRRSAEAVGPVISTVAGTGTAGYNGNGIPATQARLYNPTGVAMGPDGSLYISDSDNYRVRRVGPDGIITTVAGTGISGYNGDGIPATQARLGYPYDLAMGPDGSLYVYDYTNSRIRRIGSDGIITTVAGTGTIGYNGDGIPATQAQIGSFVSIAVGPDGSLYIADNNNRVRRVGPDGIITTVVNFGEPRGVAVGPDGSLYITGNSRVHRLAPDGSLTPLACTGGWAGPNSSGDGGPATQAVCVNTFDAIAGPDGAIYIADYCWIRRVGQDGTINTVAGAFWYCGSTGDGGPATQGRFRRLFGGLAIAPDGTLYISDTENQRVRRVALPLPGFSVTDLVIASEDGAEGYIFNSSGRHLRTVDTFTGAIRYQFGYDSEGRLATVTDADGNVTTIQRDTNGNPTAIIAPHGQQTVLTLNPNGYLASVSNPAGDAFQFAYTNDGLMTTLTDPRNFIHKFTYDSLGLLTKDEDPAGGSQTLARTDFVRSYEVTRTTGENRTTTYRVENLTTGDKRRINTFPDGTQSLALNKTDGSTIANPPDGSGISIVFGPDPRFGMQSPIPKSVTVGTPGGLVANMAMNRAVTLTDPANPLSLTTLTDTFIKHGQTFATVYAAATKTFTNTTPVGRQSTATIDALGRIIQSQISGLNATQYSYDSKGRLSEIMQGSGPDARSFTLQYNPQGYLSSIADPLSNALGFEYDQAGRLTKETLRDGGQALFSYNQNGNITSITPPGRPAHSFAYNAVGLRLEYDPPVIGLPVSSTQYSYNIDRQLVQVSRPDGQTITLSYDAGGRLSTVTTHDGPKTITYDPAKGYVTGITRPGGNSLAYTYDGPLLTGETWGGDVSGSVSWTYDNDFRITGININGGNTIGYQYDNDGLTTKAGALTLSRSAQNAFLTGATLGNVSDTLIYNSFGEPTSYVATYNASPIFSQQLTYDKLARITSKTEIISGVTDTYGYTYDATGRLTAVTQNNFTIATYTYDTNGNRLSYSGTGGTANGTYDDQDRLTHYGSASYSYTAHGNLQSRTVGGQTTLYDYDAFGNLKSVTLADGTLIAYVVDGRNRPIGKKVNGTWVRKFLYRNSLKPLAELDAGNNVVSVFVYGSRYITPDYMLKGGVTYRIISDHLGSPRLVVDVATGSVAQRLNYDEFGNVLNDTNPGFQPFGFAGGLYDHATGLVRYGARDYDPEIGRWTAKDPGGFTSGLNLYTYAANDPINLVDPMGNKPVGTHSTGQPLYQGGLNNGVYTTPEEYVTAPYEGWNNIPMPPPKPGSSPPSGTVSGEINTPTPAQTPPWWNGPGMPQPKPGSNPTRCTVSGEINTPTPARPAGILGRSLAIMQILQLLRYVIFPEAIYDDFPFLRPDSLYQRLPSSAPGGTYLSDGTYLGI